VNDREPGTPSHQPQPPSELVLTQGSIRMAWRPSSTPNVTGYKVYLGHQSGHYDRVIDVGNTTSAHIEDVDYGTTYYATVRAYSADGLVSQPAPEGRITLPALTATATSTPTAAPAGSSTTTATATPTVTAPPSPGALRFDRTAFEAVLGRPVKHRQVFAATQLAGGRVLHYMENSMRAYAEGLGAGPGTLHTAAVLYGPHLLLAADDSMWAKYPVGALLDELEHDLSLRSAQRNPYAAQTAALVRAGASLFVCDNALTWLTGALAARMPKKGAPAGGAVHDDLVAHLVEGAMVVPAGVAALNAAQEARFTLVQATIG